MVKLFCITIKFASGSNLTSESRLGLPLDLPNIVVSLQAAISCFIAEANDDPNPFAWLAEPKQEYRRRQARVPSVRFDPLVGEAEHETKGRIASTVTSMRSLRAA